MPRVMLVVLGLGVLVWGLAFADFGKPRAKRAPVPRDEPSAEVPATPMVAHAPARPPKPAAERATAAPTVMPRSPANAPATALPAKAEPYIALRPSPSSAPAPTQEPALRHPTHGALSAATGELGEGINSPEYAEMERSYAHEPRDGEWADGEEQRVRGVLEKSPLASKIGLVNCQETMCRVLLESDDYDVYAQLLAVPGFRELTGLGPGSSYSHRTGQLSVYFPRRDAAPPGR